MPKYRVETNDGTYEIESDREPTPNDVESYLRQSQAMAAPQPGAETITAEVATPQGTVADSVTAPVAAASAPSKTSLADTLKAEGWENLKPAQRLYLLGSKFPEYFGRELLGIGEKTEGVLERAVPPAAGQTLGRASRIPGGAQIGGFIGGVLGETVAELREEGSMRPGAILAAGITGATTGRPLASAGGAAVAREGARLGAANVAGKAVETAVDEGRAPSVSEVTGSAGAGFLGSAMGRAMARPASVGGRASIYNMENETLQSLRKEGVVIPPHEIGAGSDTLASIGGKAALQQEASKRNQFVWQKLVREDIGLSKESLPIRPSELVARREQLGAPYREIQKFQSEAADELDSRLAAIAKESDPHTAQIKLDEPQTKAALDRLRTLAAADIDELKVARDQAKSARIAFFAGNPNAYDAWQAAKAKAEGIEDAIEKAAETIGDSQLTNRLKYARQQIAKTHSVEESLNLGNGFVDPLAFGRQLANGERISGNLEKIAKFQLAFRREAVEASRVPASGVGAMGAMSATNMASRGDAPGLIGAAVQMTAGRAVRPYLLSDYVQEGMLNPREVQNFSSALARYISENAAELSRPEPVAP